MYRRPKFLEKLLEIRQEMAVSTNYSVGIFAEFVRTGVLPEPLLPASVSDPNTIDADATEPTMRPRPTLVEK